MNPIRSNGGSCFQSNDHDHFRSFKLRAKIESGVQGLKADIQMVGIEKVARIPKRSREWPEHVENAKGVRYMA